MSPGITSLADTSEKTLLWVRESFLYSDYDWGKLVIHGHTVTYNGRPDIQANRIGIDTGAVYGGKLTALLLPEMEIIMV
jgi:serine/threonine protein phosphatase 1